MYPGSVTSLPAAHHATDDSHPDGGRATTPRPGRDRHGDADGARRAITELDRHQYGGRNLTVNEARPMAPRGNDGGFGGGRQRHESRW